MNTFDKQQISSQSEKLKVLIADDDTPTRILLRAAISRWNYEIVEASDGEEAWKILQQPESPQLLILDWLMPKLDGVSLCQRIKTSLLKPSFIILLSQLTGTTNITTGLEAGADEFLSKPFNMIELQSRLAVGARVISNESTLNYYALFIEELEQSLNQLHLNIKENIDEPSREILLKLDADLKLLIEKTRLLGTKPKATYNECVR